jgi:hypothetical protein
MNNNRFELRSSRLRRAGVRLMQAASEDAVRKWKFAPHLSVSFVEAALSFALAQ